VIDVLVVGAGPAGWALADACARLGLRTSLVAPRPHASWRPTYGMWLDETAALPRGARWVTARARVLAGGSRWLARPYAVLDNESVRSALTHPEVSVVEGRAVSLDPRTVTLADGRRLSAGVVINATGAYGPRSLPEAPELSDLAGKMEIGGPPAGRANGPFARRSPHRGRAEQTAYGVFVSAQAAAPLVSPGEAIFMDWRQPMPGPATFLYAVPTPDGRVLLEETSLAARPGLSMATLRERLHARLTRHGISPDGATERVRFPVDRKPLANAFGAAAGITHPATGYGVADMLALAPTVAKAIARGKPVHRAIWSPQAKAVRRLRLAGLATILALPPDRLPGFFALFFDLPPHHQRAFLSGRADLPGTAHAMAALFRVASWSLRRRMIAPFPGFPTR
jgi:lycopene beta-cyclase